MWALLILTSLSVNASDLDPLVELLTMLDDAESQLDILKGMREGLRGQKSVRMPKDWPKLYPKLAKSKNEAVREQAKILALIFGDPTVLKMLRQTMMNAKAKDEEREQALTALVEKGVKDLAPNLHELLNEKSMRSRALRALAAYNHKETPNKILSLYNSLSVSEKQDALNTLASRASYALTLLNAMEKGKIKRQELSAFTARSIQNLGNKDVTSRLSKVWGEIRLPDEKRKALMAQFKKMLTPKFLKRANLSNGRMLFQKTCMQCHMLHGEGGKIGPDLTGSNRANLDYILENVLDRSCRIAGLVILN